MYTHFVNIRNESGLMFVVVLLSLTSRMFEMSITSVSTLFTAKCSGVALVLVLFVVACQHMQFVSCLKFCSVFSHILSSLEYLTSKELPLSSSEVKTKSRTVSQLTLWTFMACSRVNFYLYLISQVVLRVVKSGGQRGFFVLRLRPVKQPGESSVAVK
jgi:hypothetical protein